MARLWRKIAGVAVQLLFSLFVAAGAAWFWLQFARPSLVAVRARPAAQLLILGLTVLLVVIEFIRIGSVIADIEQSATWTISSVAVLLWALIVAYGYPGYRNVLRATGGPDQSR
jgi:hypothetical protein